MNVLLAGEGKTELGDWAIERSYRATPPRAGVLERLARRVSPGGWNVVDAVMWSKIRKYQAGGFRKAETRNVLGLALKAIESGAGAVVFSRDLDAEEGRAERIEAGIEECAREFPQVRVAGGHAIPVIDAWLLALAGDRRTEEHRDAKRAREKRFPDGDAIEELIDGANLDALPDDAESLRRWLSRVREVLPK